MWLVFHFSFCIGSQLEFALQAAPWCRGAGDSKCADVPLGGERPHSLFDLIYNIQIRRAAAVFTVTALAFDVSGMFQIIQRTLYRAR